MREYARDRRGVRRRRARLRVSVSPFAAGNGRRPLPALEGHAHDVSATGLALILPAIRIGEHYLAGEDRVLLIVLELPSGPVQMRARTVRYERLDESGRVEGYLIGARITQMSEDHRAQFLSYLEGDPGERQR
jgi:hypothetical protein